MTPFKKYKKIRQARTKIRTIKIAEEIMLASYWWILGSCLFGWWDKLFAEFCGCKRSQLYVHFSFWYALFQSHLFPLSSFLSKPEEKVQFI